MRVAAGSLTLGRAWSALAFDPDGARAAGLAAGAVDLSLRALVAVAAVAAGPAVGARLVGGVYGLRGAAG